MSRLKHMPAAGWFVAGVAVAVLVIPATVGAVGAVAALKFTGIEGTSTNKADVTPAGQLQVAPVAPASLFQNSYITNLGSGASSVVAAPPTGDALIVDDVHVVVYSTPTSISYYYLEVEAGTACSGAYVGTFHQVFLAAAVGNSDDPLAPGLVVPSGDSLCMTVYSPVDIAASVSGYTVPAAAAPALAAHAAPAARATP
jgi:hypothetical protein